MTVYVDDFRVRARVGRITGRWSHLTADTREELHEFATRIGLQRSWFQEPKGVGGKPPPPGSLPAQAWHYDVTESKRQVAINAGAIPLSYRGFLSAVIESRRSKNVLVD
jgi:hypothetical protein